MLDLPNGIPSHDTRSDVFGRLKPEACAAAFLRWGQVALPCLAGEQLCVEGKTLRGSRTGAHAVHLMSAYAAKARLVLAQQPVGDKTNEITAIPTLLSMLALNGAVVSMDAMGCQKPIARDIADAGAAYGVALKDNHPQLGEDVRLWLDTAAARGRLLPYEPVEKDHGRIEHRRYVLSAQLDWLPPQLDGAGLQAVGRVESTRHVDGKTTPD